MFAKAWSYLQQQFNRNHPPQPEIPSLIPFIPSQNHPNLPPSVPKAAQKKPIYSLVQQSPSSAVTDFKIKVENDQELKEHMKNNNEDLQYSHSIIDDLRQLQQQIQKMTIHQKKLQELQSNVKIIDHQKPTKNIKQSLPASNENEIRSQYLEDIIEFLGCKYNSQKKDYPTIPYPIYRDVYLYWKDKKKGEGQLKTTSLQSVKKLTYKSFGLLDQGQWLNDDIVSIYIELMEKELAKDTKYKLFNSFFATTTLAKTDNMIQRATKRKNLEKGNIIILPVNDRNHWYFVKIQPGKMTIYDSLSEKQPLHLYLQNTIIKNILKFGKNFYEGDMQPQICKDFPKQYNGFDCGVFMLMGIKDVVREQKWNFRQGDINYKRMQLASQILTEKLMVNQNINSQSNDP